MKLAEIFDSVPTFITNDEAKVLSYIKRNGKVLKKDLKERDLVLVDQLVTKNALKRCRSGKEIYFVRKTG